MKTIIITGASSGIGKSAAEFLSDKGYKVIGTSRKADCSNDKFDMYPLDVTSDTSVKEFSEKMINLYGRIDVLFNNAGFGIAGPLEDFSMEETRAQLETNFFGVIRMNNAFIPHMKKQGGGLIINTGSMAGLIGLPFQGHYSASKFALEGYVAALRMELKPFHIHVTNINPGDFNTGFTASRKMTEKISGDYEAKFRQLMGMYEHDELNGADPSRVARLIYKLVKKEKGFKVRYLTGNPSQTIGVPVKRIIGDNLFEKLMAAFWKISG